MATITFTISPDHLNKLVDAICINYNYQPLLPDDEGNLTIPNPESKAEFTRRMIINFLKENVKAYNVNKDVNVARDLAIAQSDITVT